MGFISTLLAKLHAEFTELRGKAHPPAINDKLHEVVDELVARFHDLEARVEASIKAHAAPLAIHHEPAAAATEEPASLKPAEPEAATEAATAIQATISAAEAPAPIEMTASTTE